MFSTSTTRAVSASVSLAMLTTALVLAPASAHADATGDEFDHLRQTYADSLTGGDDYSLSDSDIVARVDTITTTAQAYWDTMITTVQRNRLWNDSPLGTDSAGVTRTYEHIRAMALAYSTRGSSLEGEPLLRDAVIDALEWMNEKQFFVGATMYQNWWHWQIGAPLALNDIVALMYDDLTASQIADYTAAIAYVQPSVTMSGANRLWESQVIALSGINAKDASRVAAGRDGMSALYRYVTSGDGFSTDGSFVQHSFYAYNGGYGVSLLAGIADLTNLLHGSTWAVTDPDADHVVEWVYGAYEPFVYRGNLMDMVRGREISRYGVQDNDAAVDVMVAIIKLSEIAPASDAAAFRSMVKHWLQLDTDKTFLSKVSVDMIVAAKAIIGDPTVAARGEVTAHRRFPAMDRVVHLRPDYGFGLSMSSSRIGNYESINAENAKGWHTGDGMTYLYNSDLSQFNDAFWPTVDSYRLPGTTVLKDTGQTANSRSDRSWVGGVDLGEHYGVTGMELHPVGQTLEARKSWFMFDDEIVALGAGIASSDGVATETVVENRKLAPAGDNVFTVDGVAKPTTAGWSETMVDAQWMHLAGNVPGADIGYYFPDGATVRGQRETRTGTWKQVNSSSAWGSTTPYTRNYLSLSVDHGVNPSGGGYSYVLLPNATKAQTAAYSAAPAVSILENTAAVQAVRHEGLGVTGINFWEDGPTTAASVTTDSKASVMLAETADEIEVSVSDPTQQNVGMIYLTIDRAATGLIAKDPAVTVLQYSPTIKLKVDVQKARGASFTGRFALTGAASPNPAPIAIPNPYEAEALPIQSQTDSVTVYTDTTASGGKRLGINHDAIGDAIEFSVDVTQPGTFTVVSRVLKSKENGTYALSIDGAAVGGAQDGFWSTSEGARDIVWGSHTFSRPGSHLFRLTTTGKNPSATRYKLMLDAIRLVDSKG